MEMLDTEKESLSSKVKRRFGWKRKVIHEKEREDGSGEVMIELPAKHEGMIQDSAEGTDADRSEMDKETKRTGTKNDLDHSYVEVLTTLTTLFTPEYTNSVGNKDVEKFMFEDKVKCENSNQPIADTEKMCDIPVHHVGKDMAKSRHPTIPSYKGLFSQYYQPRSVFDEDMMDVSSALREELIDFETATSGFVHKQNWLETLV